MYKFIGVLAAVIALTGCAKDPVYLESLKQGEHLLRSEKTVEFYEEYYEYPQHKALVGSYIARYYAYSSYKTKEIYAIEDALARCNEGVLKKVDKLTLENSCKVLNINNEWVLDDHEKAKLFRFLEHAKVLIGSDFGLEEFEKYYYEDGYKAFAYSKVGKATAYVANEDKKNVTVKLALEDCNKGVLKKVDKLTFRNSCKVLNINNEWVTEGKEEAKYVSFLESAKTLIGSGSGLQEFEEYYYETGHKAFAYSKAGKAKAYVTNGSKKYSTAILALKKCNAELLEEFPRITDDIRCAIINIDNRWVIDPDNWVVDVDDQLIGKDSNTTKPSDYATALEKAKKVLKSNRAIPLFEKYYHKPNHKVFVQSKVHAGVAYSTNKTSVEAAKEIAMGTCHKNLLKKYAEITDEISCEVINIDGEWVTEDK
ncbi:hypothetical protein OFY17_10190 [Marinomonas sp. C2222]|uniref:Lipoprotein n=1 Tax=Marinomonas sargassi TaxID=2984494 RepID=A0ABT2YTQ8_9GAMM|nr:hypothetical protein [Marinomonas sargassi]MCV2403248.1 hypothetical protein [Marinomonas sargassi]